MHFLRPKTVATLAFALLCGCTPTTFERAQIRPLARVHLERALNVALSWPSPPNVDALVGARIFEDGPPVSMPVVAIARAVLRTNPRIAAMPALELADATVKAAHRAALPPEFLAATLLQESAYDPHALSSAGAVGIAQFELDTAREAGVNPFDPYDAIDGAANLLGGYVREYRGHYDDAYGAALAAYNAGPGAVTRYHGVPPYAETQAYVQLVYERWARIGSYERGAEFHVRR
jgi:soluble lytic murein transglycosylase-like protein